MARSTIEAWLPEEYESEPIQALMQTSVIESSARTVTMGSDTKHVPRAGEVSVEIVPKGNAYGEDGAAVDDIVIIVYKFGKVVRLAEEDIDDSIVDVITQKKTSWTRSYAIIIDNAALAVTAVQNGTTIPFTSVYYAVRHDDSGQGYLADTNYTSAGIPGGGVTFTDTGDIVTYAQAHGLVVGDKVRFGAITTTTGITAGTVYFVKTVPTSTTATLSATLGGAALALTTDGSAASSFARPNLPTYDGLSHLIGMFETSKYFDPARALVIAHPSFKEGLRSIKDTQGHPIFVENPRQGETDTLFGYPLKFSMGARTSATATSTPTGNPLVIVANRDLLILGKRSGPESVVIDGRSGASALTDETLIKMRARRAFGLGTPNGAFVYEAAA